MIAHDGLCVSAFDSRRHLSIAYHMTRTSDEFARRWLKIVHQIENNGAVQRRALPSVMICRMLDVLVFLPSVL